MISLLEEADKNGSCVYLLGAKEEVLQSAVQKVREQYPAIHLVGARNGYFDLSDTTIIDQVQQTEPDIVFVAMAIRDKSNGFIITCKLLPKGYLWVLAAASMFYQENQNDPQKYLSS